MEITVTNDGKGKGQSFEATIDINSSEDLYFMHFNTNLTGYGDTNHNATQNLVWSAEKLRDILNNLIDQYKK